MSLLPSSSNDLPHEAYNLSIQPREEKGAQDVQNPEIQNDQEVGPSGSTPFPSADAERAQAMRREQVEKELQDVGGASSSNAVAQLQPILPSIQKQIDIINAVMQSGILTPLRAQELQIATIQSADRERYVSDRLCLNYLHSLNGRNVSITHPAKGGLPVVLERENDPFWQENIKDEKLLKELSERAHNSMLFVLKHDLATPYDAQLKLIDAQGNPARNQRVPLSTNNDGCMETRANGTITPENIDLIILPERMEPFARMLNVGTCPIRFVPSIALGKEAGIPYNVGNLCKGYVSITVPNYQLALREIKGCILTHMLRGPTDADFKR